MAVDMQGNISGRGGKASLRVAKTARRWTEQEDNLIRQALKKFGRGRWVHVAAMIPGRDALQCSQHWHKVSTSLHSAAQLAAAQICFSRCICLGFCQVLDPSLVKGFWTKAEDQKLRDLKTGVGALYSWRRISESAGTRTPKQCRER